MLDFEKLKDELKNKLSNSKSSKDLEVIRVDIFGKNGFLNSEFKKLGSLSPEDKKNTASKIENLIFPGVDLDNFNKFNEKYFKVFVTNFV